MNNKGNRDWAALYADFKKSGMTVAEFARWKGIALTTSYSMISKYRKREASGEFRIYHPAGQTEFVPFYPVASSEQSVSGTQNLRPYYITVTTDKMSLEIPFCKDIPYVREVIKAVRGLC